MSDHQNNVLENRASLNKAHAKEVLCPTCDEALVFGMQDSQHEFSLGLTTVLECLAVAEKQGYVSRLPDDWWVLIYRRYSQIEKVRSGFYQKE